MSEQVCWVNGELVKASEARVSPLDRGLLYGDGVFETMRAYAGRIFRLGAHLDRLLQAARGLGFPFALDSELLAQACRQVVRANDLAEAYVRLTVTRGVGGLPSELDAPPAPTVLAVAREFDGYPESLRERGMVAGVASVRRNASSPLSRVKSLNYLDNLLARAQAAEAGADEALLLDTDGNVVEASASNVFLVSGRRVITPPVSAGVLPGITRQCVLDLCPELGLEAVEDTFTLADLLQAREAFLTNSLMEVMPLTVVEGGPIGEGAPGPVTKDLMQAYRELVREETGADQGA
jgi:branched-chain amino acid aminotransferase